MNVTMFRLGGMTAAVAATLAAGMAAAAPVYISTSLYTVATFDNPLDAKPIDEDSKGPVTSGALESYVEAVNVRWGYREGMASAIADNTGNVQVGAEALAYGVSTATSDLKLGYTNNTTNEQFAVFSFEILPGEVLISNTGSLGLPPRPGEFAGGFYYSINLLDRDNAELHTYECELGIRNTVRSWEYTNATNDCGLNNVDQFFDGNGQYGVTLKGVVVRTPYILDPGETIFAELHLYTWANRTALDWSGQISAKLGDPSDLALRSAFSVEVVDATTPPNPVPEPGSAWLASLALLGLGATRARRGASAQAA